MIKIASHPRAKMLIRIGFGITALALLVVGVASQWNGVKSALGDIGIGAILLSLLVAMVGLFFTALSWQALLADQGSPLPIRQTVRIFFLAEIGKYLPGSVWTFLAQMELGRDLGVPRQRSMLAGLVRLALQVLTGLIVAAGILPFMSADALGKYAWALPVIPLGVLALHPRILNPMLAWLFRVARRPAMATRLSGRAVLQAAGWQLVMFVFSGLSLLILAAPLGIHGANAFFVTIAAYAFAWAVGLLFLPAPSGIGVREAILVLTLTPVMSISSAVAVAAVSRVVQTAADVLWALTAISLRKPAPVKADPPVAVESTVDS